MKTQFTIQEKLTTAERLKKYQPMVDPLSVDFYWDGFCNPDVCGEFKPANNIHVNGQMKLAIMDGIADDVLCHELCHCSQYRSQGWLFYSLMNLTRLNEPAAYAEQERVRKIIEGA